MADVSRNAAALDGGRAEKEIAVRDVPEDEIIVWQTALNQMRTFDTHTSMADLMTGAPADEWSADEYLGALTAAVRAAKQIRSDFVSGLSPSSPAYDLEWELRYGSEDRLIFVFSVVIDLEEDFDVREYPTANTNSSDAKLIVTVSQ